MGKHTQEHGELFESLSGRSRLADREPLPKLLFTVLLLVLCLAENHSIVSLYLLITMTVLNRLVNQAGKGEYRKLLAIPAFFLFTGCLALLLETGEGGIRITEESAITSISVFLRSISAVSILYFLVLSTPFSGILLALRRLHMPEIMLELMYLIYRYIFLLTENFSQMRTASASRLGTCDRKTSFLTFGNSLGNLLFLSLKRAENCFDAMESRCYEGKLEFLEEYEKIKRWEYGAMFLYLVSVFLLGIVVRGR